uniref:Uncharacterized protein n=1 Tax=Leptobrachium leishanense TaxID=445787 RepID=A0A8C5QWT2_9ANUR
MAVLLPILVGLLVSLLGCLYLLGMFRKRKPNEPPLDKGFIPWLGYGLDFRNNSAELLKRMQKKHGDIFTIQLAGYFFTFIMDPLSFSPVVKEARSKVFDYHVSDKDHKMLEKASTKYLMGDGLILMTQAMMENLQNLMLHNVGSGSGERKWHEDGLFNYSYNIVFRAGYLTLFGNEPAKKRESMDLAKQHDRDHSEELFYEFRKYGRLFPRVIYAVLSPKCEIEAERLKRRIWNFLSVKKTMEKENISGWISDQCQYRLENDVPEYMQDRVMFLRSPGIAGGVAWKLHHRAWRDDVIYVGRSLTSASEDAEVRTSRDPGQRGEYLRRGSRKADDVWDTSSSAYSGSN